MFQYASFLFSIYLVDCKILFSGLAWCIHNVFLHDSCLSPCSYHTGWLEGLAVLFPWRFSPYQKTCLYLDVGSWTVKNIHGKHMLKSGGLVDQEAVNLHIYSGTFKSHWTHSMWKEGCFSELIGWLFLSFSSRENVYYLHKNSWTSKLLHFC